MYADHASTALPVLFPAAADPVTAAYGNPAATHAYGRAARAAVGTALRKIARALRFTPPSSSPGATATENEPPRLGEHFVATGGGTEADNLVLLQPDRWSFIVLLPTEHHAVTLPAEFMANHHRCELVYLTPTAVGGVDPAELAAELRRRRGGSGLVSVAAVNNEIGTVADLEAVGAAVAAENGERTPAARVWLHTDAVQAPGHVPLDLDGAHRYVDFMSLSAHKFHGPPGFGLLFCRTPAAECLRPRAYGGGQQAGLRPGTEPVAALVATAAALEDATEPRAFARRVALFRAMTDLVWAELMPAVVSGSVLPTGAPAGDRRAPNHVSFCIRGAHRRDIVRRMEETGGVAVSGGSACNATADLPSHVLTAIRIPPGYIHGSVRITFSHTNTLEEVRTVLCPALRACLRTFVPPYRR
jgi:cysteine desulfurase